MEQHNQPNAWSVRAVARTWNQHHIDSWCVFVAVDDKAQRRQVEIGQRSDFVVEVRQGLAAGACVVLHPTEQLEEGSRLRRREELPR